MPLGDIALIAFLIAITPFGLSLTWASDRPYAEIVERRRAMKWIALGLIVFGSGLAFCAKPAAAYGEEGLPLYALIGWGSFLMGVAGLAVLVFMSI